MATKYIFKSGNVLASQESAEKGNLFCVQFVTKRGSFGSVSPELHFVALLPPSAFLSYEKSIQFNAGETMIKN